MNLLLIIFCVVLSSQPTPTVREVCGTTPDGDEFCAFIKE